jgi:RNA polymerase sigma-70 factor (ECF subfamily)
MGDYSTMDDAQLMLAYASGDTGAFEVLYARHKSALLQYMVNSCGSESIASEMFQDVWLRVINGRDAYQPQSPFNAWLYRIARHRLIDHYRSQGRVPKMEDIEDDNNKNVLQLPFSPLNPEQLASINQRESELYAALQQLSEVQREAILLRHIVGMSIAEIATVVETGTETIKSRLRYAISKLRIKLEVLS